MNFFFSLQQPDRYYGFIPDPATNDPVYAVDVIAVAGHIVDVTPLIRIHRTALISNYSMIGVEDRKKCAVPVGYVIALIRPLTNDVDHPESKVKVYFGLNNMTFVHDAAEAALKQPIDIDIVHRLQKVHLIHSTTAPSSLQHHHHHQQIIHSLFFVCSSVSSISRSALRQ